MVSENGKFYIQADIDVYPNGAIVIIYRLFHYSIATG
jgi:hypothetical protein